MILFLLIVSIVKPKNADAYRRPTIYLRLTDCLKLALESDPSIKLIETKIGQVDLDLEAMEETYRRTQLIETKIKETRMQLENQKENIIDLISLNIYNLYYTAVLADRKYDLAKIDERYTRDFLEKSRANYDTGRIDRLTLQGIEELYNGKVAARKIAYSELEKANISLLLAINKDTSYEVHLTDKIIFQEEVIDIQEAEYSLLTSNRELLMLQLSIDTRKLEYKVLDKEVAGKNEIKKAKYSIIEAKANKDIKKKELILALWERFLAVRNVLVQIEVTQDNVEYYTDKYQSEQARYKQGLITSNEVNQAKVKKLQSLIDYKDAVKNYIVAKFNYEILFN